MRRHANRPGVAPDTASAAELATLTLATWRADASLARAQTPLVAVVGAGATALVTLWTQAPAAPAPPTAVRVTQQGPVRVPVLADATLSTITLEVWDALFAAPLPAPTTVPTSTLAPAPSQPSVLLPSAHVHMPVRIHLRRSVGQPTAKATVHYHSIHAIASVVAAVRRGDVAAETVGVPAMLPDTSRAVLAYDATTNQAWTFGPEAAPGALMTAVHTWLSAFSVSMATYWGVIESIVLECTQMRGQPSGRWHSA